MRVKIAAADDALARRVCTAAAGISFSRYRTTGSTLETETKELPIAERLARERYDIITGAIRRLPVTLLLLDLFMAWLLWRLDWHWLALVWFGGSTMQHAVRWIVVDRWRREPPADLRLACQILGGFYLFHGVWRALGIGLVFMRPPALEHHAVTALCLGIAAGAITASGWSPRLFASWALVTGGALVTGWVITGGAMGFAVSVLIVAFMILLYGSSRDQLESMKKLIRLAIENEELARRVGVERDRAEEASRAKSRFFAAAGHDLRQPLYALALQADTLTNLAAAKDRHGIVEVADKIKRSLHHLNDSIDGVLDLSRFESDALTANKTRFPVRPLLESVVEQFRPLAEERQLKLVIDAPSDERLSAYTDRELLLRILHNLLSNALKFTSHGEIRLAACRERDALRLSVSDTGPGIAVDEQEKIFQEFYRIRSQAGRGATGLGLGLSIVKLIGDRLGARIELDSEPGRGSRFDVYLEAMREPQARLATPPSASSRCDFKGLRVLAIDDDEGVRSSLLRLLGQLRCDVRGAAGTREAMDILSDGFTPQIILADYWLAGETGLEVIAAIRTRVGWLPAAVVSADDSGEVADTVRENHVEFLRKSDTDGTRLAEVIGRLECAEDPSRSTQPGAP